MIPVYVNVFNRLTTTRNLCDQISRLDGAEVVIIDNDSTWEPLLDWYATCPYEVIRLKENLGHHAPWLSGVVGQGTARYYVVTDCDLCIADVPDDVLTLLAKPFGWGRGVVKSGLGLRIDDLPPWQAGVAAWETRWSRRIVEQDPRFYWAAIDTTFAMYSHDTPFAEATKVVRCVSTRTAAPYLARHMPWYLDCEDLDEENANYFTTANASNSWKPDGKALSASYIGGRHAPRRI